MKGIYLVGGYPDFETFSSAIDIACESGFQFIEVGVPFSDPVADGPVIAKAAGYALEKGVTFKSIIEFLKSKRIPIDVYIMTYANIIWAYRPEKACQDLRKCNIKGCIIADLPNNEREFFTHRGFELPIIGFATPESTYSDLERLADIQHQGFIYFISIRGITGQRFQLDKETKEKLNFLKKMAKVPVILGFGIKSAEDIKEALKYADGFVIGTKAVEMLGKGLDTFKNWCKSLAL